MFNRFITICLTLLAVSTAPQVYSDTPCDRRDELIVRWKKTYQNSGTSIFQPAAAGDSKPAAMARLEWDKDPQNLYRLISSYALFPGVIPNVKHSQILETRQHQVWVYQQLQFPGPLRDRHYIIKSTDNKSRPSKRYFRVEWTLDSQFPLPKQARMISPASFSGCWDIRPAQERGLDAVYWIELEAGGLLPDWMVRTAMRRYLTELMAALRDYIGSIPVDSR